jgi:hypothetical protein
MTMYRGHQLVMRNGRLEYEDETLVPDARGNMPCGKCSIYNTPEGHDACLGTLPNAMNACCGHGNNDDAYIQFNHPDYADDPNKKRISGDAVWEHIAGMEPQ